MELYLLSHDEYLRLYNCSVYGAEEVPIEKRRHIFHGLVIFLIGVCCEFVYVPCVLAIRKHLNFSAYKLLFCIGAVDICAVVNSALLTGYLAIVGATFCTHPDFIYVAGAWGLGLWIAESSLAIILAVNRCVEVRSAKYSDILFHGNRTWMWIVPVFIYQFYVVFFTPPVLFNGVYLSWFYNPYVGLVDIALADADEYTNNVHVVHNCVILVGMMAIYVVFLILLFARSRTAATATATATTTATAAAVGQQILRQTNNNQQTKTFVQAFLISFVNALASAIYVYMQFAQLNASLILVGSYAWLLVHGLPPMIYLSMNGTIRRDCRRMFAVDRSTVALSAPPTRQVEEIVVRAKRRN